MLLHIHVEEQSKKNPAGFAIEDADGSHTYYDLAKHSNQIATYLLKAEIEKEAIIAVSGLKNFHLIAAMLGILKAGATMMLLNPEFPADYRDKLLDQTNPALLLVGRDVKELYKNRVELRQAVIEEITDVTVDNISIPRQAALAAIIYTSGSTGKPKGILLEHDAISHVPLYMLHQGYINAQTRFFSFSSINFDTFLQEVFSALIAGGVLILELPEACLPGRRLHHALITTKASIVVLPPRVLEITPADDLRDLSTVMSVGEQCQKKIVRKWKTDQRCFLNGYGPAEAGIGATIFECQPDCEILIGKPFPNVNVYLLDQFLNPVPDGCEGEIFISGIGVAKGYLNDPQLTAEKFLPDFFSATNQKMYKTGDVGRRLPDGNIEFLGRQDQQVQINGCRVELDEFQHVLLEHPGILSAIAILRENIDGTHHVCIFFVIDKQSGWKVNKKELFNFLHQKLPRYMYISILKELDAIPLTMAGKVDREQLALIASTMTQNIFIDEPENDLEQQILDIWKKCYPVDHIGVTQNFSEIGCNSMHAMQIVSYLDLSGFKVTLNEFFQFPTIRQLAQHFKSKNILPDFNGSFNEIHSFPSNGEQRKAFPLTFLQQGLLFHGVHRDADNAYIVQNTWEIFSEINIELYKQSWQRLLDRHDVLRSRYLWEGQDMPIQVIEDIVEISWVDHDYTHLNEYNKFLLLRILKTKDAKQLFNLKVPALMRFNLIKLKNDHFYFVWTYHHILLDGYSMHLLLKELDCIYTSLVNQTAMTLPEAVPFVNFLKWQSQQSVKKIDEFWRHYMAGYSRSLTVSFIKKSKSQKVLDQFPYFDLELSSQFGQKLLENQGQHGITVVTFFKAAWTILLAFYSQENDIVCGTIISLRHVNIANIDKMVGVLINTLPMRVKFSDDKKIKIHDFLIEMQKNIFDIMEYGSNVSLAKIKEWTNIDSSDLLFDSLFLLINVYEKLEDVRKTATIKYSKLEVDEHTHYPLTVSCWFEDVWKVRFSYNKDLVDVGLLRKVSGHLKNVLEFIAVNLDKPINEIAFLSQADIDRIMLGATGETLPIHESTVIQLFENQVRQTPQLFALTVEEMRLTYFLLNKKANQLARYLIKEGVSPGNHVAVFLERGVATLVSCLAILKAGAIYIPVDPLLPVHRIATILTESMTDVLITKNHLVIKLGKNAENLKLIDIEKDWQKIIRMDDKNLNINIDKDSIAYIVFTSGTTDKPKGVKVSHKTLINLVNWHNKKNRIALSKRVLQFANLGFDVSLQEIFTTLTTGCELFVVSSEVKRSIGKLVNFVEEHRLNRIFFPTHYLNHFIETAMIKNSSLASLEEIILSGDALMISAQIKKFFLLYSHISLVNQYGPSESHVVSMYCLPKNPAVWTKVPPIGRPIANIRVYVLDKNLQILPPYIKGYIYIGGICPNNGYVNVNDSDKFMPDPFFPAERMYNTGDIGEWDAQYQLCFLGRNDGQIKVMGYRVELKEIETILLQHEEVSDCVICSDGEDIHRKIYAYVVLTKSSQVSIEDLQQFVLKYLPRYMLPSHIYILDSLPLSSNGKVDTKLLLQMSHNLADTHEMNKPFEAPRNEIEIGLASIWSEVLAIQDIGINDNFFDLGGHSFLALQVQAKVFKHFSVDVALEDMFSAPTLGEFAVVIDKICKDHYIKPNSSLIRFRRRIIPSSIVPLQAAGSQRPIFFVHPISGTAFWFVHLAKAMGKNRPCYAIQDPGIDSGDPLFDSIEEMAAFYVSSILNIQPTGSYLLAGASFGSVVTVEIAKQLNSQGKQVAFLGLLDGWAVCPSFLSRQSDFEIMLTQHFGRFGQAPLPDEETEGISWLDLQLHRAKMLWNYELTNIHSKVTLFKAQEILDVFESLDDPFNHWRQYCEQPLDVMVMPGNHESMFEKPNVIMLAKEINQVLWGLDNGHLKNNRLVEELELI